MVTQNDSPRWYKLGLGAVLVVAGFLDFFQLGTNGYGNLYYAAGVKSMLDSWSNFYFVSFDPAGFVSIDKPPLGLWTQALSAKVLGFSPFSLLLPQAICGLLSTLLLAHLVRKFSGPLAGLLAALLLTITPIWVVTSRNITMDTQLMFVCLLSTWAIAAAIDKGKFSNLLLCGLCVGLGFNIKMLEAYLMLPAFILLYWFSARITWKMRLAHLLCFTLVVLVISSAWMISVDLTSASLRPFVGSSGTNSETHLALYYNGVNRVLNARIPPSSVLAKIHLLPAFFFNAYEAGNPGLWRLVTYPLSAQIGLLLPLTLLGLASVQWDKPALWPLNKQQQGIVLWGAWLLTLVVFFSSSSLLHSYYTVTLAPALCALAGIGIATTVQGDAQRKWLTSLVLVSTAVVQLLQLKPFLELDYWFLCIVGMGTIFVVSSVIIIWRRFLSARMKTRIVLTLFALLLIIPCTWSIIPVLQNRNVPFPFAGPTPDEAKLQQLVEEYNQQLAEPDIHLVRYLLSHSKQKKFLVATFDATTAAPLILETNRPVMALGGYDGRDTIITFQQLQSLFRQGSVRYVLLPKPPEQARISPTLRTYLENVYSVAGVVGLADSTPTIHHISTICTQVPPEVWDNNFAPLHSTSLRNSDIFDLYDCAAS